MKKQLFAKRTTLYLCQALLAVSLINLVSCKPKIEEDPKPREYELHTEETEGKVVVSEKYVPVDWDKSTNEVLTADAEKGEFTMHMSKEESNGIKKGSLMTIDVDSTIYLVKVTDYKIDGENVELQTEQASLAEVFGGSSFELRMGDDCDIDAIDSMTTAYVAPETALDYEDPVTRVSPIVERKTLLDDNGKPIPRGSKLKIYPSEIRYRDENGTWIKAPVQGTRFDFPPINFSKEFDYPFLEAGPGKVGVRGKLDASIGWGASLFMDVPLTLAGEDDKTEVNDDIEITDGVFKPTLKFNPSFTMSAALYAQIEFKGSGPSKTFYETNVAELKFMVGPVPVLIVMNLSVLIKSEITATGEASVTISGKAEPEVPYYVGFYVNGESAGTFAGGGPLTHKVANPVAQIGAGAQVRVMPTLRFGMHLYGVAGPRFDYSRVFDGHINGGKGYVIDLDDGETEKIENWDLGVDLYDEAGAGLTLHPKISKLLSWYVKKDIPLVAERISPILPIVTAPSSIKCNNKKIRVREDNEVEFQVNWQYLANEDLLSLVNSQLYLETDEAELYPYGSKDDFLMAKNKMVVETIDETGKAKVIWHPQSQESTLTATIYDGKGIMRDSKTIKANTAPDVAGAVDLGCSVLWANMNVGATTEFEGGDLVGWGDKSGTATQQWNFPDYGSYKEGAVYSLKYYGGPNLDRSGIAHSRHDYATAKWGGDWRMPTEKQWKELMKKCKWEWDEEHTAYKVTGSNGNYIYLPAAGYRIGTRKFNQGLSSELGEEKASCEYWSSTMDLKTAEELNASYVDLGVTVDKIYPNAIYFYAENSGGKDKKMRTASTPRYYGQSVRPVCPNPNFDSKK